MLGLAFLLPSVTQADTILLEDFEDATLTYSGPADAFGDLPGSRDYYGRFAPDTVSTPSGISLSNTQGSGYYAVEDTNGATGGGGSLNTVTLNWSVNASAYENLSLSWFVAEDDDGGSQDWDPDSSFIMSVQLDSGGFNPIFQVEAESAGVSNSIPRVDTNFDGVGDGTEITDTFAQFSTALADAGTVDIRVEFINLTAQDEDFAFDNLHLEGDLVSAIPEPGTALMFSVALIGCFVRRRRRG